jgi:subtilisin family serine protease
MKLYANNRQRLLPVSVRNSLFLLCLFWFLDWNAAATLRTSVAGNSTNEFRPGRLLIKPSAAANGSALAQLHRQAGSILRRNYSAMGNLQVVDLAPRQSVSEAIRIYQRSSLVEYAEPDYILRAAMEPNDPKYQDGSQWPLYNWGQLGGIADCDIDAPEAWDLTFDAQTILVSVIDSGIRVTHEDLATNLWTNPGEIPGNGVDDDDNGYIDDVHGINAINGSGTITDEPSHGTHVAGILGAAANNGRGIAGVAWRVKIMGCKFLDAGFQGSVSDAVECIDYSRVHGARIVNASWGGNSSTPFYSMALYDAIDSLRQAGIIFVAAAGNFHLDNDSTNAFYPASFNLDNIISVAATTREDRMADFSNYGANSVDLGAPGYVVLSCWSSSDNAYDYDNGTSMAAPHVAAACALAWTRFPNESYQQIIQRVLNGTDPIPDLANKCRTGGRLNLRKVLTVSPSAGRPVLTAQPPGAGNFFFRVNGTPGSAFSLQTSTNLKTWQSVTTNQLPPSGELSFYDPIGNTAAKYYRAILIP